MSEFLPLGGVFLDPKKPIHGPTEATGHSHMAGTPLELGLRAGGNGFHDAQQYEGRWQPPAGDSA